AGHLNLRKGSGMDSPGARSGLKSMSEATWSRGLWHRLGGLPGLIQAARAGLADPAAQPLSLLIVEFVQPPAPVETGDGDRWDDRRLVEAVNYLRQVLSETKPGTGSLFALRTGEFARLVPGVDAAGRGCLQAQIRDAVGGNLPLGSRWFGCGGATAPDDGTQLASLWLAADSRRLAAR